MGTETKVEKMFMTLEDGQSVVWEGIKDIQFTESEDDDVIVPREFLTNREVTFTAEIKWPKFFRCKNRKRYKKLMMSLGLSRDYMDQYLKFTDTLRRMNAGRLPTYQELWSVNLADFLMQNDVTILKGGN